MNNEKQQQAKNLYFQTGLNKTEIASLLKISRRSLFYWIRKNNWARLKLSATHLPAMLVENNYLLIAQHQRHLLSEDRIMQPLTRQEVEILYKLSLSTKKLKNHSSLNEGMEIFAHLIERVNKKSPELAEQLAPFIEEHIENWASITLGQFKPDGLNDMGYFPSLHEGPHSPDENPLSTSREGNPLSTGEGRGEAFTEQQLDHADIMAWEYEEELKQQLQHFEQKAVILSNAEGTEAEEDRQQNERIINHIKSQILKLSDEEQTPEQPSGHCHYKSTEGHPDEGRNATRTEHEQLKEESELKYFQKNGHSSRIEHFRSFGPDSAEIKRREQLMAEVLSSCGNPLSISGVMVLT